MGLRKSRSSKVAVKNAQWNKQALESLFSGLTVQLYYFKSGGKKERESERERPGTCPK